MATWFEAVALSRDVYQEPDRPPLPDGWVKLIDSTQTTPPFTADSYFGAVYYKPMGDGLYDVVIAHRGTADAWGKWEDFELWALHKTPAQYEDAAKPFVEYVIKNYPEYIQSYNLITYTGHSLGAMLAELCVAQQNRPYLECAFTFESPGSKPTIQKLEDQGLLPKGAVEYTSQYVLTCNADVNAINTCQEQISPLTTTPALVGYHYDMGVDEEPSEWYYFSDFTCKDQHKIIYLYEYWQKAPSSVPDLAKSRKGLTSSSWPVGLTAGYKYYLTYENHEDYWDGYMKKAWDTYPYIRKNYDNDYPKYVASFIKLLAELKKQVVLEERKTTHQSAMLWQVFQVLITRLQELETENKQLLKMKEMLLASFKVLHRKYTELTSCENENTKNTDENSVLPHRGADFFPRTKIAKERVLTPKNIIEVNALLVQKIKKLSSENKFLSAQKTELIVSCRLLKDKIDAVKQVKTDAENSAAEDTVLSYS